MARIVVFILCVIFLLSAPVWAEKKAPMVPVPDKADSNDKLAVVWTSGDPDVAKKMVFLYTYNAKKQNWFKNVTFVVWGASTKLLSQDKELQDQIKKMKEAGIELYACKWCSDSYGVSDVLVKLGIKVIYYGKGLTKLIKEDWKILTF
jgi:hypothetical protein